MNIPSDHELIDRSLAGRTEAFGTLMERYQHRLFGSLVHVLRSREDAEDVAQEAFLNAYARLATFRGESAFYSWLFRIALNAAASRRRKSSGNSGSLDTMRELTGHEPEDENAEAPSEQLEAEDLRRAVRKALDELPDDFRVVVVLKEFEGFSYDEISKIVDCPVGTVRSRIHRGRQELREKLMLLQRNEPYR